MAAKNITDMNASVVIVSVNHFQDGLSLNQKPTTLIIYCGYILWCSLWKVKQSHYRPGVAQRVPRS
jgi:hypothetical protein